MDVYIRLNLKSETKFQNSLMYVQQQESAFIYILSQDTNFYVTVFFISHYTIEYLGLNLVANCTNRR